MSEPFIGEIKMLGFNWAPRGFMLCQGQQLALNTQQALYSLLGTYFGGDGVQSFKLPDLRGRVAVGQGAGPGLTPYQIGQAAGAEGTTLSILNLPVHNHPATTQVQGTVAGLSATTTVNAIAGPSARVLPPSGNFITSPVTAGTAPVGVQAFAASGSGTVAALNSGTATTTISGGAIDASATTTVGNNGGSQPFDNRQPFLAINYAIATIGVYPSRN